MKILKQNSTQVYGNDCFIYYDLCLLEISSGWIVIKSEKTSSSWTPNTLNSITYDFTSIDDAYYKYEELENRYFKC